MSFGLTNAPAAFQSWMNDIFREIAGVFVVVYLDDILIYSDSEADHIQHVRRVLEILRRERLSLRLEKCSFHVKEIDFLGFIISEKGLMVDPAKIEAVKGWPTPTSLRTFKYF